jgi:hypothetical protein
MNGLADQEDLRLRFDVLTKTKQPELRREWTTRDRAANWRLFRPVAEVLRAIEAGVFHPNPRWACKDCPFRSRCCVRARHQNEATCGLSGLPVRGALPWTRSPAWTACRGRGTLGHAVTELG